MSGVSSSLDSCYAESVDVLFDVVVSSLPFLKSLKKKKPTLCAVVSFGKSDPFEEETPAILDGELLVCSVHAAESSQEAKPTMSSSLNQKI